MNDMHSASNNVKVNSKVIRRDFIKDYGPILTENGFIKSNNAFYRVHGNDVLNFVGLILYWGSWTVTFASVLFSQGFDDTRWLDGVRMENVLLKKCRNQSERESLRFSDRSPENYNCIRERYHTVFFNEMFPVLNNVTSIETYIEYIKWLAKSNGYPPFYDILALANFQAHDYEQGAAYMEEYLQHSEKSYKKRINDGPSAFTKAYDMYKEFVNDVHNGCTTNIDSYMNAQIAITVNTCSELKLITASN